MILEISVTVAPNQLDDEKKIDLLLKKEIEDKNIKYKKFQKVFIKKSVDARHGKVKVHLRYKVYIDENPENQEFKPKWKNADEKKSVIIIGSGPAGLFGALKLLEYGIKPVIIERGKETLQRKKDIAAISTKQVVDENSNYCFGEGGAGTFSDGKLYTRSNKRGNISEILQIFNYFGADKKILTDSHPHIGTDRLPLVINAMRNKILALGGEIHFEMLCREFICAEDSDVATLKSELQVSSSCGENSAAAGVPFGEGNPSVRGVKCVNLSDGTEIDFYADCVVLAAGHSADDIYIMLAKTAPKVLEAKTFAMGVRVEHPRKIIDEIQFHGQKNVQDELGAAEYRLVTQVDGRGVYSFCMCPGGFVVPSASENDGIVVNGMSSAARNSKWSNAAIVVEIRPEDIPSECSVKAERLRCAALSGLFYRKSVEVLAKKNGKNQAAPAQRLTDFLAGKKSETLPPSSFTAGLVPGDLSKWLPSYISERLKKGFTEFNKMMKGFVCDDAILIAPETRTSTPVRILRNKETCECDGLKNVFPCGEGSGYSGGIVSSAMDGQNVCVKVAEFLKK